jgi:SAM-dependent methyltransferase
VSYDRIAERYDATRGYTPEGTERIAEILSAEFAGAGRVLEIGIGTGQLALALHAAGVDVAGLDRSVPMLSKVGEKAGGRPPFPVVIADATEMPFADGEFGGAYFRWILHLIRDWRDVMTEAVRVVRPGGEIAGEIGGFGGAKYEVQRHYEDLAGIVSKPLGLPWSDWASLDAHMESLGCRVRLLPSFDDPDRQSLAAFIDDTEANIYSWTWNLDEGTRVRCAQATRAWAKERFGDLGSIHDSFHIEWHAFEVRSGSSPTR